MFGLSTWEILIILVLALLFIGPDELPKMANKLGKHYRQVKSAMSKVDDEVRRTVRDFQAEAARLAEDGEDGDKAKQSSPDPTAANAPVAAATAAPSPEVATKEAIGGEGGGLPIIRDIAPAPAAVPVAPASTRLGDRDWSQIGKTPVEGRVATAQLGAPAAPGHTVPLDTPAPPVEATTTPAPPASEATATPAPPPMERS